MALPVVHASPMLVRHTTQPDCCRHALQLPLRGWHGSVAGHCAWFGALISVPPMAVQPLARPEPSTTQPFWNDDTQYEHDGVCAHCTQSAIVHWQATWCANRTTKNQIVIDILDNKVSFFFQSKSCRKR